MNHVPALLFLAGMICAVLGCVHEERARNHGLPLVHADYRAVQYPPWRLYATCPVDQRNVPILNPEEKA